MKLINIFLIFLILSSCTNLDEEVYDQLTQEKYLGNFTEDDIPSALGPLYNDLRGLYIGTNAFDAHVNGNWLWASEETSDLWVTPKRGGAWYDGGIYFRLNQHKWGSDETTLLGPWRSFYKGVNTCNRLIEQFSILEDEDQRNAILAEIKIGRAFWYYNLADFYGNVPLVTEFNTPEGFLPKTNSRKEIVDFVIKEIEENLSYLPEQGYGRWNKYSASHLLAKVYLNHEKWVGDAKWDEVISLCNIILDEGGYSLEADYSSPFKTENENSPEIIMGIFNDEIYHADQPFLIHLWTMHYKYQYHQQTETSYWGGPSATPEFANSYHPEDLRFAKSWLEGQLYDNAGEFGEKGALLYCDPWNPRDNGQPLYYSKDIVLDDDGITTGEKDGVRMVKYEIKPGARAALSNDFVLFRLAEVYFMKAEAIYRKNGKSATQEVADLINTVKARAFDDFSGDKVVKPGDLDDNKFLMEYAWEFCQEGHRRQQLIRFDQFASKSWFLHEPSATYRELFPIPLQEINANPNLIQNPDY